MGVLKENTNMQNTSRTPYGAILQLHKTYGIASPIDPALTIDGSLGIDLTSITTPKYTDPEYSVRWAILGNNGYNNPEDPSTQVDDELPIDFPSQRDPRGMNLFNMIPQAMVKVGEDVSSVERRLYGIRNEVIFKGEVYAVYYGIRLDDTIPAGVTWNDVYTGNGITPGITPHTMKPKRPTHVYNKIGHRHRIQSSLKATFIMTQDMLERMEDACALLYGRVGHAVINEIGLCAGTSSGSHLLLCNSVNTTSELGVLHTRAKRIVLEIGSADNFIAEG